MRERSASNALECAKEAEKAARSRIPVGETLIATRAGRTGTPAPVSIQSAASCCSPLIVRVSAKADLFVVQ